jgi:flavodoxin
MKCIIVYCSKTGNTEKVAKAIARGLSRDVDMAKLDLSPEGLLNDFSDSFTLDLTSYDLIFFGGWVMVMRVHPYLYAYIKRCSTLKDKKVVGFLTGGAGLSREHAFDDFRGIVEQKGADLIDLSYTPTLLGLTLTRKKLKAAEAFAREIIKKLNP